MKAAVWGLSFAGRPSKKLKKATLSHSPIIGVALKEYLKPAERSHMAPHGDIDHAVLLRYRHLGGAGSPPVATEKQVNLIYGDGLLEELNRLVGLPYHHK